MVRRWFYGCSALLLIGILAAASVAPAILWTLLVVGPLVLVGVYDVTQRQHTILRNFPIIGHGRYLFEVVRPEIQQYFIESNTDAFPIEREFRDLVYQRAKGDLETQPFGTQRDVYRLGYEWTAHSLSPVVPLETPPRIQIGGADCRQPYASSLLNISAMSFGALSSHAILALNGGASAGGFAHNTGEGGISPYHLKHGGDLIWQIGTGYFGCRTPDGRFDPDRFADQAALDGFVELAELAVEFELDRRMLAPYLDRAARQLESLGRGDTAVALDQARAALGAAGVPDGSDRPATGDAPVSVEDDRLVDSSRLEPRFISESYFMDFTFEPGNYYLAGRETVAGREVVKIEYYPTNLFDDDDPDEDQSELEVRIDRGFNKTSLVTLWIDPDAEQIVKYTFDNTGLDFLPGRWLVRIDGLAASMEMGQPIGDVWLPLRVTVSGVATTALGGFDIMFTREFTEYREAETGARMIDAGVVR